MLKFKTRTQARLFASKTCKKVVDLGIYTIGSRWSVVILKKEF